MGYTMVRNNFFIYGETGERLSGIRESDIYKNSARTIRNLVLTELGNLKFAKQYNTKATTITDVREVIDTRYNFFVVVTKNKIYTLDKKTYEGLYYLDLDTEVAKDTNIKMFDDNLMICYPTPKSYAIDPSTGKIGTSNFIDLLKYPVVEKEEVKIDVYKAYKVGEETRVVLLSKYTNPKLESKSDGVYLYDTGLKLNRIYKQYKSTVDKDDITNVKEGEIYGVLYRFQKNIDGKNYVLGNNKIVFTGETNDSKYKSSYFTSINVKNIEGELNFGKLQAINKDIIDIGVMSDRLCIIQDNTFYFSKKNDYFDFRNGTNADDPFYFKPTPISNQKPNILRMRIGNQMYVATDKGVYVVSFQKVLTPTSYSVFIAGETPCTRECELINDNFYYIATKGSLKCVQSVPNEFGYESYRTLDAEKYDVRPGIVELTKVDLDSRTVLVATHKDRDVVYLYDSLEFNSFRRTSLDLDSTNKLFGYNEHFIADERVLVKTDNNYAEGLLNMNPPFLQSNKGGSYSNDYQSQIVRTFMKLLNEDRSAVKGVYLIDQHMPLDNKATDDRYSTYKYENSTTVGNGYSVKILSNENDKVLEILGIENKIKVASD